MNALVVLAAFLCAVRAVLAAVVVAGTVGAWRARAGSPAPDGLDARERRLPLVVLAAGSLSILVVGSWPLLYLALQSLVPQRPDAMCIYGITQIGSDAGDWRAHLPAMLRAIEGLKPLVIFVGGTWLVRHLVHRRTAGATMVGAGLPWLGMLGIAAGVEALVEGAWLLTTKPAPFLVGAGCCTSAAPAGATPSVIEPLADRLTAPSILAIHAIACSATFAVAFVGARGGSWLRTTAAVAGLASTASGAPVFSQVAAPWLMNLPEHRCVYCLLATRPESIVTLGLLVAGVFLTLWGACCPTRAPEAHARQVARRLAGNLFAASRWCLAVYAVMLTWELVLARW